MDTPVNLAHISAGARCATVGLPRRKVRSTFRNFRNVSLISWSVAALALFLLWSGGSAPISGVSSFLYVFVALIVAMTAFSQSRSWLDSPIYLGVYCYVLFVGIGPILLPLVEFAPKIEKLTIAQVEMWPLVVSWIGFAAMGLGYWVAGPYLLKRKTTASASPIGEQRESVFLLWGGLLYTLIGVTGVWLYLWQVGGLEKLLDTAYGHRENLPPYQYPYELLRPALLLLVGWAISKRKLKGWQSLGICVYLTFVVLWFGPIRGARHYVFELVIPLICLLKLRRPSTTNSIASFLTGRGLRVVAIVGVFLVLLWGSLRAVAPVGALMRSEVPGLNVASEFQNATMQTLFNPFDGFVQVVDSVPRYLPYTWGSTFYESLTMPIPRVLWPSKPYPMSQYLVARLYGMNPEEVGNTVATWPGELYLDFGVIGVVIGMIGTGMGFAWLTRWGPRFRSGQLSIFSDLLYAALLPLPLDLIWGGSNAAVWCLLINVFPIFVVIVFAKLRFRW